MSSNDSDFSDDSTTDFDGVSIDPNKEHGFWLNQPRKYTKKSAANIYGARETKLSNETMSTTSESQSSDHHGSNSSSNSHSQSANFHGGISSAHGDLPSIIQQQRNWDAYHPPKPSSLTLSKQERMRRLRANRLPFFPNSFARYHQAQKNHDKKKAQKANEKWERGQAFERETVQDRSGTKDLQ